MLGGGGVPEPELNGGTMRGNAETMRERNNGSEEEPRETCGGGAVQGARAAAPCWARLLRSLLQFTGANLFFWFLALTSWRVYHLISLTLLGLVFAQMMKDLVLSRVRGAQLWRSLSASWEVMDSKPQCRPRLTQCIADSWSSCTVFLQELSLFKQQNPGKFCLLVCGLCTFLTILGSYIPGVVLSYSLLLCAFLYPLIKCNQFGQKIYNRIKPALLSLDFGFRSYFSQRSKERSENPKDDESELDLSALCPEVSPLVAARELSVSDTEPSEVSWTDNGTFNLSEGHTPQTDTSDDFDRRSDQEEAFARDLANFPSLDTGTNDDDSDSSLGLLVQGPGAKAPEENDHRQAAAGLYLPLASDQALHLASDMVAAAVSAAVREQLQSALQQQAPTAEDLDVDEVDDFELLDQSELEQMEEELGLAEGQEAPQKNVDKKPSSFLSHLLGGH